MCGLVGMAGDMGFKHRHAMKTLLFFNTLRGKDSTGVAVLDQNKSEISIRKLTCPGYDFVQQPWIDGLLGLNPGVWLGHGRHKTVGEVTRLNAHPFDVRTENDCISLFGAHNGTLHNKWELEKELKEQFGTDSEALLNLIERDGAEDAIKQARGAWALTWWADDRIHFLRNKERTLYYAFDKDRRVLIWASELWMIRIVCFREGIDLEENPETKDPVIYIVPEDTLMAWKIPTFKNGDNAFGDAERKGGLLGAPEKKTFQSPYQGGGGLWGGWDDDPADDGPSRQTAEQKTTPQTPPKGKSGEKEATDNLIGFEGQPVSAQYVNELKKLGCDWCGGPIKSQELFAWLDDMSLCCRRCLRGDHFTVDVEKGQIVQRVMSIIQQGGKQE